MSLIPSATQNSAPTHNTESPSLDVEVTKDSLLKMYKEMVTIRCMEQSADVLYKSKLICGFCHLTIGQMRSSTVFPWGVSPLMYHSSHVFCLLGSRLSQS